MASKIKEFFAVVKQAGNDFNDDNATKLSASLAYYTIFSIGPLLLVIITLLGLFYKKTYATTEVMDSISQLIGKSSAVQLQSMLVNMGQQNHTTLFGVIGILVLMFGATGIFTEIQSSINYIWSIKATPKRGWLKYITNRLVSFALIIGMGFLLMASLLINVIIDVLNTALLHYLGNAELLLINIINISVLYVIVTFLFLIIYKILPDASIHWKDALVGAAFTGVLFLIGKFLITYYLASSSSITAFGAAASIILFLSWVYYSSLILYFGAEFTKVYALRCGRGIVVNETAVYIVKHETRELEEKKQL